MESFKVCSGYYIYCPVHEKFYSEAQDYRCQCEQSKRTQLYFGKPNIDPNEYIDDYKRYLALDNNQGGMFIMGFGGK